MIVSGTIQQARLDAIAELVSEDVKGVTIFFNEKYDSWCVESEIFTEEELDMMADMD